MKKFIEKASILTEALPYIKKFKGITIVIKYGGSAIISENIKDTIIQDIALMKCVGFNPVVVHGGGPDINKMLKTLDIKSEFINGLRVTTEETMEVVEMVLSGKINKSIVSSLNSHGINAVGISGRDGNLLKVNKYSQDGVDLGFVGEIAEVDPTIIKTLISNDFVPVISPIGFDDNYDKYNVNADMAAVAVATALKADKLVFLTDVDGVRKDMDDANSVYSTLTCKEIETLIEENIVTGGMIPKVTCCVKAVSEGVEQVHILDGRVEHSLLLEVFTDKGVGTLVYGDDK